MTGVARLASAVIAAACSTGGVVLLANAWRWQDPPPEDAEPAPHPAAQSGLFAIPPTED